MCFSPEADLVAGIVIGVIGVDAFRHVRSPRERPLAALPIVFAFHQLIEVVVWRGLQGHVDSGVWHAAAWLYLAVAFGVVPVLVPFAVAALEPEEHRAHARSFVLLGALVAAVLMYAVVRGPVEARLEGHHIAYSVGLWHGGVVVALYVVATTGSMLMSSLRYVRWVGLVNLVAVALLAWLNASGLISLWCIWAAVVSIGIALHLRREPEARVLPPRWEPVRS